MASLDKLPVELHTLILVQHDSLQSLHSHIRASPQGYRVFLASKARILFTVLRRLLGPDVFHITLAAAKASLLGPRPLNRDTVLKFASDYMQSPNTAHSGASHSLPAAIELCRLHLAVDAFIDDFVHRYDSFALQRGIPLRLRSSAGTEYIPLSSVELSRLRRAFYTLHSFGRLFCARNDDPPSIEHGDPAQLIFPYTPVWQVEELACVEDYIVNRLYELYDALENDFVKGAVAEARANRYGEHHPGST